MNLCSSTIDLTFFFGSVVIALLFGIVTGILSNYFVQYRQNEILIKYAKNEKDEMTQKRSEYINNQLKNELLIMGVIVIFFGIILLIVFYIFASSISAACNPSPGNDNSQSNITINYISNYYYYNISQIIVVEKSQTFSIEELKRLVQTKTGVT